MYEIKKKQQERQRIHTIVRIISAILYMILIPIIIFNFTLIIKSFIDPNEIPDFFGYKSFVIVSGSMEPTIMTGDAILVKEVSEDEIKTNDIISFSQEGTIVTHRITEMIEENGKLYGLGVCDMKGGLAGILQAVTEIDWEKVNYGMKLYLNFKFYHYRFS